MIATTPQRHKSQKFILKLEAGKAQGTRAREVQEHVKHEGREAQGHARHRASEARRHVECETRETPKHIGHKVCEAREYVVYEARRARNLAGLLNIMVFTEA